MRSRSRSERGSVTAETAVLLPVLALLVGVLVAIVHVASGELAAQDAARVVARAVGRGEPAAAVQRLVAQVAPVGAQVSVHRSGSVVDVIVSGVVRPSAVGLGWLPSITVRATATATDEPATAGP